MFSKAIARQDRQTDRQTISAELTIAIFETVSKF